MKELAIGINILVKVRASEIPQTLVDIGYSLLDKLRVVKIYSARQADKIAEIAIELKKTNTALAVLAQEQKLIKDIFVKVT